LQFAMPILGELFPLVGQLPPFLAPLFFSDMPVRRAAG